MSIDEVSQPTIEVDVAFYDEQEERRLLAYPPNSVAAMKRLVSSPLIIPTSEFLTYFLFHRKGRGFSGYGDLAQIRARLYAATHTIDTCLRFNGESIVLPSQQSKLPSDITEHVGESIGLSVVSRIHGLTDADWTRLPAMPDGQRIPSFDFQIHTAADSDSVVQLENKGTAVQDNRRKPSAVSNHKRNIANKKATLTKLPVDVVDPYPASLRYGTIAALDPREDGRVRCWLVDPDPERQTVSPRDFRLITRMAFLHRWLAWISPRSQLASALATRLQALRHIGDPFELDRVALVRGTGEPFEFPLFGARGIHTTFLANKSRVTDGPVGGMIIQLGSDLLVFLAIREELVNLAVRQDFSRVVSYEAPASTLNKTVECVFHESRFRALSLPEALINSATKSGHYVSFRLSGQLHYSRSGLVFGFLRLPE